MKFLITGGAGFLGSNLAKKVLENSPDQLLVFDNLSRVGAHQNLEWLQTLGQFEFVHGDVRNFNDIETVVKNFNPDVIFHVAGQVAMTTSIVNPRKDFEINALGTFNVLESVRLHKSNCVVAYSSTNKVYGDLTQIITEETLTRYQCPQYPHGFDESLPIDMHSPYGCSKGTGDQYLLDYYRTFEIPTVVLRHSSIYGGRQFSTIDQGWIGWFCQQALNTKIDPQTRFTVSGNGKQVRDVLHVDDAVDVYFKAVQTKEAYGNVFNIGGGIENSLSLLELFDYLENKLSVKLNYNLLDWRHSDQKVFVADIKKAQKVLNWKINTSKEEGLDKMIEWIDSLNQMATFAI